MVGGTAIYSSKSDNVKKTACRRSIVQKIRDIKDQSVQNEDFKEPLAIGVFRPPQSSNDRGAPIIIQQSSDAQPFVPRHLQSKLTQSCDMKREPTGMTRASQWTDEIENLFRFQEAGYRDAIEYCSSHSPPEVWDDSGFVRMLQNKKNGCFIYFRRTRECQSKDLKKIKLYKYD